MSSPKHTYRLKTFVRDAWWTIVVGRLAYLEGWLDAARERPGPRPALRLVRSDGRVMAEAGAKITVSIGQVVGFATPEQYEAAAAVALETARQLREHERRRADLRIVREQREP